MTKLCVCLELFKDEIGTYFDIICNMKIKIDNIVNFIISFKYYN